MQSEDRIRWARRILNVYETLRREVQAQGLAAPVVFGGVAAFLCSDRHAFRPGARKLATDLDILVREGIEAWQAFSGLQISTIEDPRLSGFTAKIERDGITVDLIGDFKMVFAGEHPPLIFAFDFGQFPPLPVTFEHMQVPVLHPVEQFCFKWLLWRGEEQGKYDREDVLALFLGNRISPQDCLRALFRFSPPDEAVLQVLRARLESLLPICPQPDRLSGFIRRFQLRSL